MPIRNKKHKEQIRKHLEEMIRRKETVIIRNMGFLGEQCLNVARASNEYKDQTANLRASTGFLLLKDGQIITKGGFETVSGKGETGTNEGESFAKSLISKYMSGFVLIVVAGMNYAAHVEARNKDVLTSAELYAQENMPRILKMIGLK